MEEISRLLINIWKGMPESEKSRAALRLLQSGWKRIAGDTLAATVRPVDLDDRVLVLGVEEPAHAEELAFLTDEIGKRCNAFLGTLFVKDVRLEHVPAAEEARPEGPAPAAADLPEGMGDEIGNRESRDAFLNACRAYFVWAGRRSRR